MLQVVQDHVHRTVEVDDIVEVATVASEGAYRDAVAVMDHVVGDKKAGCLVQIPSTA